MILHRVAHAIVLLSLAGSIAAVPLAVAKKTQAPSTERPFIEVSLISAPRRVGDFMLDQSRYDPETKHAGVAFRYLHPDHTAVRVDVFVYPAGDLPAEDALKRGMEAFIGSFDAGVRMNYYHDLSIVARERFDIAPTRAIAAEAGADPAVLAALAEKPIKGERMDPRYRIHMEETGENVMMRSRGYLFYKQLYYVKGRMSAAESLIDQATYAELTDRAMRELVPEIEVRNVGDCSRRDIALSPDRSEGQDDIQRMALPSAEAISKQAGKNCYATVSEAKAAADRDVATVAIEYDANDWKSR